MIERIASIATTVSTVGCGVTAGVLLAFSVSVMPALRRQPPSTAITSMQQMNIDIVSPVFMTFFLGSAVAATIAAVASIWSGHDAKISIALGAALFVVGCVAVTIAVNVPMNDALAAVDPDSSSGARVWADYLTKWTRWNNARTVAAVAATAVLAMASRR
nr:anthrone oxygenase family protein [Rhodococcus sp. (in: high G+C Gram-positive bacteria)]